MYIRMLKMWHRYPADTVWCFPDGMSAALIGEGIAEETTKAAYTAGPGGGNPHAKRQRPPKRARLATLREAQE